MTQVYLRDAELERQLPLAAVSCCSCDLLPSICSELTGDKFLHIAPLTLCCVLEEEQSENTNADREQQRHYFKQHVLFLTSCCSDCR